MLLTLVQKCILWAPFQILKIILSSSSPKKFLHEKAQWDCWNRWHDTWTQPFGPSLFGPCHLDPAIWTQLPLGPSDNLDPAIWTQPFGPSHLNPAIWTQLPIGPSCHLDPATIWTQLPLSWNVVFWSICHLEVDFIETKSILLLVLLSLSPSLCL